MIKMHRWSPNHPVPLHVSDGKLNSFILICDRKPPVAKSTDGVSVNIEKRNNDWILEFKLNNNRFYSVFNSLYKDVCDRIYDANPLFAGELIIDTYNNWKNAFSSKRNELSSSEIQGIIGELITIRDVLLKLYSPQEILNSWMLLDYGKQDFIFKNFWYEIKSTHIGNETIKISSIEQLDCTNSDGIMCVIKLKKTSKEDPNHLNINKLIDELYFLFSDNGYGAEFMRIVNELGLPSDKYDDICFNLISIEEYDITDDFPHIKRKDLDDAIGHVEYEIDLRSISEYRRINNE